MTTQNLQRRSFLRGSLVAAAMIPVGGALASCAGAGAGSTGQAETGTVSENNPFGVPENSTVDAVIFNGGYGTDYVEAAAAAMGERVPGVTAKVSPATALATELQPRFVGGNPPDLIDNAGAQAIGIPAIVDQLADLDEVLDTPNYDGTPIRDTLYPGVVEAGTFDGRLVAINYVLNMSGLWYSGSLYDQYGWTAPTTWDEALALGAEAKKEGKYLFCWGKEAATYYQTAAINTAIKQSGDEVRLALENLEPECWSKPALQEVFGKLDQAISQGYFAPGGAGTQFTAAQTQWSQEQSVILYPAGSFIENEMKDQTKEGFEMRGVNSLLLDPGSAVLPVAALNSSPREPYIVPSGGVNPAGGKELLRSLLSPTAAANFSSLKRVPTVVRGTVPPDGFGSTALLSQNEMIEAAGSDTFQFSFDRKYGLVPDMLTIWNSFLDGSIPVAELTSGLQKLTDKVREDDAVKKTQVS